MSDTLRNDPQCLSGSFQKPGCAAERFKAKIAELERALTKYEGAKLPEEPNYLRLVNGFTADAIGNTEPTYGEYVLRKQYEILLAYAAAQAVRANEARATMKEECARTCVRRSEDRFSDYGVTEPDTNASYYAGSQADEYETRDEEDESCAAAIRALQSGKE